MPYIVPTVEQFKAKFPAFSAVGDDVIQGALDEAQLNVDESWIEKDYQMAIMLYAAHVLTLAGYGTGAEAAAAAKGMLGFIRVRSGSFEWQRGASTNSGGNPNDDNSWFRLTIYGQRFLMLLKRSHPGILVV